MSSKHINCHMYGLRILLLRVIELLVNNLWKYFVERLNTERCSSMPRIVYVFDYTFTVVILFWTGLAVHNQLWYTRKWKSVLPDHFIKQTLITLQVLVRPLIHTEPIFIIHMPVDNLSFIGGRISEGVRLCTRISRVYKIEIPRDWSEISRVQRESNARQNTRDLSY